MPNHFLAVSSTARIATHREYAFRACDWSGSSCFPPRELELWLWNQTPNKTLERFDAAISGESNVISVRKAISSIWCTQKSSARGKFFCLAHLDPFITLGWTVSVALETLFCCTWCDLRGAKNPRCSEHSEQYGVANNIKWVIWLVSAWCHMMYDLQPAGDPGCGKSFLLLQVVNYALSKGWIVLYIPRGKHFGYSSSTHLACS